MAKTAYKSVDQYIAAQPAPVQPALRRLRGIIRKAVPRAEEVISYQIPAYKLPGATVIYFAGWKQHVSLYPASPELVAEFRHELAPYELSKGTIRAKLPWAEPEKVGPALADALAAGGSSAPESKPAGS